MNIYTTPGKFQADLKRMVAETKKYADGFIHLGKAQTIGLAPSFKGSEFTILLARLMMQKLKTGTTYDVGAEDDKQAEGVADAK
jgi:hypothetical protein